MADKMYFIAQVEDTKTNNIRSMSMLAVRPFLDTGPESGKVAEHMLKEFVNNHRDASDWKVKYYFFNWCFLHQKYGKKKSSIKVHILNVVDESTYHEFNEYVSNTHIMA